jgi:hypothetical protein
MKKRVLSTICLVLYITFQSLAQSRDFIRQQIDKWGSCKNVAITATGGDVALYGTNGYATTGSVPASLTKALKDINEMNKNINEVVLTENGSWIVLYGHNGIWSSGIPEDLKRKMHSMNDKGELIESVALNDSGDWVIIGDKIATSSSEMTEIVETGMANNGRLWAAHFTNTGVVFVYAKGFQCIGDVPIALKNKLKNVGFDVHRVKFTQDAYFIADKNGNYSYSM